MTDKNFLSYIGHTPKELEAAKVDLTDLRKIHDEHESRQKDLEDIGEMVRRALARLEGVHSTSVRVKSPRSLAHKVVRKQKANPERNICFATYKGEIRDLIGLRALHLFKEGWAPIHSAILNKWHLHPDEPPLAYLRKGDSNTLEETLKNTGFKIDNKDAGYRSLHYIIQANADKFPCYAEIQVRTLFEEAWGEIDHQVRYPDHEDDALLKEYLLILNRLSGGADEMASLLLQVKELQMANEKLRAGQVEKDAKIESLQQKNAKFIEALDISEAQKQELKKQLTETEKTVRDLDGGSGVSSLIGVFAAMREPLLLGPHTSAIAALAAEGSKRFGLQSDED